MPNNSSATTNGKPLRSSTCLVYDSGPFVANALEIKCSIRNNPTGTMPLRECSRRSRKECPAPARRGATAPFTRIGAVGLAVDRTAPYDFRSDKRTVHYLFVREAKSRRGGIRVIGRFCSHSESFPLRTLSLNGKMLGFQTIVANHSETGHTDVHDGNPALEAVVACAVHQVGEADGRSGSRSFETSETW